MAREFVLYTDNHALQYIMQQPKLNIKHVKWVEYLQSFSFCYRGKIPLQLERRIHWLRNSFLYEKLGQRDHHMVDQRCQRIWSLAYPHC